MNLHQHARRAAAFVTAVVLGAVVLVANPVAASTRPPDNDPAGQLSLTGDLNLHDPTVWKAGDTYFAAASHRGIWSAPSLTGPWTHIGNVPTASWAGGAVWAPHVQQIGDTTYYYYSTSSFGTNNSAIGLKTTKTPHIPSSYVDHGSPIVASGSRSPENNTFNAIDAALEKDEEGNWWMVWGSHYDGIFIQQLADDMVTLVGERTLVAHRASERFPVTNPSFNRIEGPSVFKHGEWYYLLTAWDWCCRASGDDNTYKIVAGRSKDIAGPYLDKNGIDLARGGGTIILNSRVAQDGVTPSGLYRSPGAPDYFWEGDTLHLVYHAYRPGTTMGIRPINWDDGWPYFYEPGGGPYDLRNGSIYQLRVQAGSLADPDSLQNPKPSDNCLAADGGALSLAECSETSAQYFMLERVGNGFYGWRSLNGGKDQCVTMSALDGSVGTPIGLAECGLGEAQQWYFDDTGHGFHRLVGNSSNLALEVADPTLPAGAAVFGGFRRDGDHQAGNLTQAAKWPPQQWRLEMVHDVTPPVIEASLDDRQRVVVEATDDISGVALIEYSVSKKNQVPAAWTPYDGPFQVDAASTVRIRAVDASGNVSAVYETGKSALR